MTRFNIRVLLFTPFLLAMVPNLSSAQYWSPDTIKLSSIVGSLAINANGDVFAGTEFANRGGGFSPAGVYLLTKGSSAWSKCTNPSYNGDGYVLGPVYGINYKGIYSGGDIFVGSVGSSLQWRSTNNGTSWTNWRTAPIANPYDYPVINFIEVPVGADNNGLLMVSTGATGLQISTDDASSWTEEPILDGSSANFVAITAQGSIFGQTEGLQGQPVFGIGNGQSGETFTAISNSPSFGNNLVMASDASGLIVVGGTNGLWFSTNNGSYFAPTTPVPSFVSTISTLALAVGSNGNIYAGLSTGGMYLSTDQGADWTDVSSGLPTDTVNALAFNSNGALYAATNNGVFTFNPSGSGVATASAAPSSLTLAQNTPNPVSLSTNIQFSVPDAGPVSLRVFDVTGREVATVASGFYAPGTYNVSLDAHSFADGAYYYRIESGGQTASRMFVIEH